MFDQPNNFPQILFHAWECLTAYGPMQQVQLESLLAPSSFAETAHQNVHATIDLGLKIHVFADTTGLISNSDRILGCSDYNSFRRIVRDIYFDQTVNSFADLNDKAGNLQLASAWYFSFPFEKTPGRWKEAEESQTKDFGPDTNLWPIPNDTQWTGFDRWMRFFGLGVRINGKGREMVLRPTVLEVLEDLISGTQSLSRIPLGVFLDSLTQRLPSYPGGIIYNQLPADLIVRNQRNNGLVAETLAYLRDTDILNLEVGADYQGREVFSPDSNGFTFDFVKRSK